MKDKEDIEWLNEENTWIPHKVNQRRLMEDLLIFLHKFEIELENIFEERDRTREEDHIYKKIKHIFKTAEKEYDLESIYDMDKSPYLRSEFKQFQKNLFYVYSTFENQFCITNLQHWIGETVLCQKLYILKHEIERNVKKVHRYWSAIYFVSKLL